MKDFKNSDQYMKLAAGNRDTSDVPRLGDRSDADLAKMLLAPRLNLTAEDVEFLHEWGICIE